MGTQDTSFLNFQAKPITGKDVGLWIFKQQKVES